jgi:hypothetical protein
MTRRLSGAPSALAGILATALLAGVGRPVPPVLALMGDAETVAASFTTETLDPPTNLNATATLGLIVTLTWTATVDTRATGYQVLRGTSNGGPYTQVATVTPRMTTTYVDVPLVPGTYYYVLRTYYLSWTSVNSNQDSVGAL